MQKCHEWSGQHRYTTGVVSGCCCKEVYRYPHNNYLLFPTPPLVLALFLAAASLLFCSLKKYFFRFCLLFLCNITDVAQRTFEMVQKLRSREHSSIINYIDKNVRRLRARASPETSTCEAPRDVSRKLQLTLCVIMAL